MPLGRGRRNLKQDRFEALKLVLDEQSCNRSDEYIAELYYAQSARSRMVANTRGMKLEREVKEYQTPSSPQNNNKSRRKKKTVDSLQVLRSSFKSPEESSSTNSNKEIARLEIRKALSTVRRVDLAEPTRF